MGRKTQFVYKQNFEKVFIPRDICKTIIVQFPESLFGPTKER